MVRVYKAKFMYYIVERTWCESMVEEQEVFGPLLIKPTFAELAARKRDWWTQDIVEAADLKIFLADTN